MKARRLKPLVWPLALLAAAGLTALLAEATAYRLETAALYGMVKLVSDLVLAIGAIWLVLGIAGIASGRGQRKPSRPRS